MKEAHFVKLASFHCILCCFSNSCCILPEHTTETHIIITVTLYFKPLYYFWAFSLFAFHRMSHCHLFKSYVCFLLSTEPHQGSRAQTCTPSQIIELLFMQRWNTLRTIYIMQVFQGGKKNLFASTVSDCRETFNWCPPYSLKLMTYYQS